MHLGVSHVKCMRVSLGPPELQAAPVGLGKGVSPPVELQAAPPAGAV